MDTTRLPLKDMTPELLLHEITASFPDAYEAAVVAAYYHRNDTRGPRGQLPRDPYIAHPYRVALRLVRWGVLDSSTIKAAVLHDVFEDHADDIEREEGLQADLFLPAEFGDDVWHIVSAVSNPPGRLSHDEYRAHVIEAIADDPRVLAVKNGDLSDNALSLHHTPGPRRGRLARKYLPLAEPVMARLQDDDAVAFLGSRGAAEALEMWKRGIPKLREFAQED